MNEFDDEPVRGLPERPPQGEQILWQGSPSLRALALRVFHLRAAALYFFLLAAWSFGSAFAAGSGLRAAAVSAAGTLPFAITAMSLLLLLAWLIERSTVYTITNRRVVLRIGVALPITMNIPFSKIESAALKLHSDGTGEIPLKLAGPERQSFVVLWPHVRPWHTTRPEPMLRCLADADAVAQVLSGALAMSVRERPLPTASVSRHTSGAMEAAPSAA